MIDNAAFVTKRETALRHVLCDSPRIFSPNSAHKFSPSKRNFWTNKIIFRKIYIQQRIEIRVTYLLTKQFRIRFCTLSIFIELCHDSLWCFIDDLLKFFSTFAPTYVQFVRKTIMLEITIGNIVIVAFSTVRIPREYKLATVELWLTNRASEFRFKNTRWASPRGDR